MTTHNGPKPCGEHKEKQARNGVTKLCYKISLYRVFYWHISSFKRIRGFKIKLIDYIGGMKLQLKTKHFDL